MIFPPHCKLLDIFFKLISNTIYKCIPSITFCLALLVTKKAKFFQEAGDGDSISHLLTHETKLFFGDLRLILMPVD